MLIYLIRHGQTQWNLEKRMQGQMDSPLTSQGITDLQALGQFMKNKKLQGVYVSPIGRALTSAQTIFPNASLNPLEDLKEIALGDWEGKSYEEVQVPEINDEENFWGKPHLFKARPNGESFLDVQTRSVNALNHLIKSHENNHQIAVVSHTVVIKSLLHHFEGRELDRFWDPPSLYPASLSVMDFREGQFQRIVLYGDISFQNNPSVEGPI
ncbi:MAG: histidine phosphatase family protein [Spirochaetaceae bacterium]|nr:histidine phosphatase family protein [Spirochaetaceae bacterium]